MAGLRASDADRDACVEKLEAAYTEGRITDDERANRVARALVAVTRDDLAFLLHDLEPAVTPAARRTAAITRATRTSAWVVVALTVIVPIAIIGTILVFVAGVSSTGTSSGSSGSPAAVASGEEALPLQTADGFTTFLDRLRERFGSTTVVSAVIYPDYASIEVPIAGSPNRVERWYFKNEFDDEPSTRSTRTSGYVDVDLSDIDVAAMITHVEASEATLDVSDVQSRYLVIDAREGEEPAYSVYVSNEYSESGWWEFAFDGTELSRRPFTP